MEKYFLDIRMYFLSKFLRFLCKKFEESPAVVFPLKNVYF